MFKRQEVTLKSSSSPLTLLGSRCYGLWLMHTCINSNFPCHYLYSYSGHSWSLHLETESLRREWGYKRGWDSTSEVRLATSPSFPGQGIWVWELEPTWIFPPSSTSAWTQATQSYCAQLWSTHKHTTAPRHPILCLFLSIWDLSLIGNRWVAQWSRISLSMQETQETWVGSLGQEDLLEEGMATCSRILA